MKPLIKYTAISLKLMVPLLIILSACNLQQLYEPQPSLQTMDASTSSNFHPDCETCHISASPREDSFLFDEEIDQSSICIRCHDYLENHHPVNFIPAESYIFGGDIPFPRFNGEIKCLTCHMVHAGPELNEVPKLLRGGPYADRRDICFKCHYLKMYETVNPHFMTDGYSILKINDEPVCLLCHAVVPNPAVDRTNDVRFKADVAFICWRCHPPMPGEFFDEHFLITPSKKVREIMKDTEKKLNVIFPLVPRGRITCSTCHNPHQDGILIHEPAQAGASSINMLRMPNAFICNACHYDY